MGGRNHEIQSNNKNNATLSNTPQRTASKIDNNNNNKNNNDNGLTINTTMTNSAYILMQNQSSKILGVVLTVCLHNIRESFLGSNFSVTGKGLESKNRVIINYQNNNNNNINNINNTNNNTNINKNNNKSFHRLGSYDGRKSFDNFDNNTNNNNIDNYVTINSILETFFESNSSFNNSNLRGTGKNNTDNVFDIHAILALFSPDIPRTTNKIFKDDDDNFKNFEMVEDVNDGLNNDVFSESFFTDPLSDPCLSVAIKDICKLYTNLENIYTVSPVIIFFNGNNSTAINDDITPNSDTISLIRMSKSQSHMSIHAQKRLNPVSSQATMRESKVRKRNKVIVLHSVLYFYSFQLIFFLPICILFLYFYLRL